MVRCCYGISILMFHLIKRNEDEQESVKANAASSVTISCMSHCDSFLDKMEEVLYV